MNELLYQIEEMVEDTINSMQETSAVQIGLDSRAGDRLWIGEDCIIVELEHNQALRQYGGFENVLPKYSVTVGNYVIYLNDDDIINTTLDYCDKMQYQHYLTHSRYI